MSMDNSVEDLPSAESGPMTSWPGSAFSMSAAESGPMVSRSAPFFPQLRSANSPSARLAAFNPFQGGESPSSPLDVRSSARDYYDRDASDAWTRPLQTERQSMHSVGETEASIPAEYFSRTLYPTSSVPTHAAVGSAGHDAQASLLSPGYSPTRNRTDGRSGTSQAHGRRFLVRNVSTDLESLEILRLFQGFPTMIGPVLCDLNTEGHFYIGFSDIREAKRAVRWMEAYRPEWEIIPVPPEQFIRVTKVIPSVPFTHDDSALVYVYCGNGSQLTSHNLTKTIKPILDLVGNVSTIQEIYHGVPPRGAQLTVHELIVRYFDSMNAINAVRVLNAFRTEDFVIEVIPWHTDIGSQPIRHWTSPSSKSRQPLSPYGTPAQRVYMSPGGDPDNSPFLIPERDETSNAQAIDMERIYYKRDRRTTIMLRNVPFQMTWKEIKTILDTTSAGRYDFLYLRMDFDQNQNVGYAFVNFATPEDIVPFIRAHEGRAWPGHHGQMDKIAGMSYATVQGKHALVEKFRNSPVILNRYDNRPKLFHTTGPLSGREATFPTVNNFYILSKAVDRSKKNGLYRSGPRSDPQAGSRFHQYPEYSEIPAMAERDRDLGSPTRPSRGTFGLPITPHSDLQPWNWASHDRQTG